MTLRNVQAREEIKRQVETEKDSIFQGIRNKTPAEIDAWVENNVVADPSVKRVLKMLVKAVIILYNKETNND